MSAEFRHEPDSHRYTLKVDGELVSVLEYLDHGSGLVFHHTVTVPKFRGQGHAARLVEYAVDDVEAHDRGRILPSCWYVAEWFHEHPERSDLLAAR
jgi:predicted GNAT family acetyltransferase